MSKAEAIIAWLKSKIGDGRDQYDHREYWHEFDWCGDTEGGFYSEWEIDYDALLREMDKWIEETFPDKK